uniref:Uncharacterized protein n=1 Tax=Manihot esculenta TaxID=3983 RepID=A0A2C9UD20_MANES
MSIPIILLSCDSAGFCWYFPHQSIFLFSYCFSIAFVFPIKLLFGSSLVWRCYGWCRWDIKVVFADDFFTFNLWF